jgi:hypothetical protein
VPVDIDIGQHPAVSEGAEQLISELLGNELLGCLGAVDCEDGSRGGRLMHLPHAQRTQGDRNDGNEGQPGFRKESPARRTLAHSTLQPGSAEVDPGTSKVMEPIYILDRMDNSTAYIAQLVDVQDIISIWYSSVM